MHRIPELQASPRFHKFQNVIRTSAPSVNRGDDPAAYQAQLVSQARDIIDAWHKTKNDLGEELKDVLFEDALTLSGAGLLSLIEKHGTALLVAGGVAVARLIHGGRRLRGKQHANPYQYLTEILEAENETLRMTFPLGLET